MRRTKVICTIGPSSSSPEIIGKLIRGGMDVARLNCSHGNHESHRKTFAAVRSVAKEVGRNVAIMMDLQGPKIRTGPLHGGGPVNLVDGAPFCITTRGNARRRAMRLDDLRGIAKGRESGRPHLVGGRRDGVARRAS